MSLFKTLWLALTLLLLNTAFALADLQGPDTAATATTSNLTEAQAVQIAADFCQRIGQPVTVKGVAEIPTAPENANDPKLYWQTRWKVTFGEQAQLEVADPTGLVVDYWDMAFSQKKIDERNQPVQAFITKADALVKANIILKALKQEKELLQPEATFDTATNPITHGATDWFVRYRRHFQGLAYPDEGLNIIVDGESGIISMFHLRFVSPLLTHASESVSRDQAAVTARAAMDKAGLQQATLVSTRKMMTRANTFADPTGSEDPLPGPARPVWGYTFRADTPEFSGKRFVEVWVDMETGAVIGGTMYVSKGGFPKDTSKAKPASVPTKPTAPRH